MSAQDLTGIWQGQYSYGGVVQGVGFTATVLDSGGALYGTTHETDTRLAPVALDATLSGAREGRQVDFIKTYEVQGDGFLPISYRGMLSGDGTEVEGTWSIPAATMSGRFLMTRPRREATEREVRAAVRV